MTLTRGSRMALAVAGAAIIAVGLWLFGIRPGMAQSSPTAGLQGMALAEALDLEFHDGFFSGCDHYVEVDGQGGGFCIDAVVSSNYEAWETAHRIQGDPPTELDRRIFVLTMRISNLSSETDSSEIKPLEAELQALIDERDALEG